MLAFENEKASQIIESTDFAVRYPGGHTPVDLVQTLTNFCFEAGNIFRIIGDNLYMVGRPHGFPGYQDLLFVVTPNGQQRKRNEDCYGYQLFHGLGYRKKDPLFNRYEGVVHPLAYPQSGCRRSVFPKTPGPDNQPPLRR